MAPSKKNEEGVAPNSHSPDSFVTKDPEKESAIEAHGDDKLAATEKIPRTQKDPMCQHWSHFKYNEDCEETDEDVEETQTPTNRSTGASHQIKYVITEEEVKNSYKESTSSNKNRTRKEPILKKFVTFNYKKQSVTIGLEHWRSQLERWRDDLQDEGSMGVVWDERAEPWKYQKRSKESKQMAAVICDFETPSEKAGLVLHCPVEHKEDERRDNFKPLHCPCDDEEDGSPEKEIVKIYIGPERLVIRVYRKILCEKIQYFENFFNGTSQEAASNSVTFPSGDFEAFHDLMWWASNGHLPPWSIYPDGKKMGERTQHDRPVVRIETGFNWGGLYLLASRLCVEDLMNLIADYVVRALELNRALLTKEDIAGIYKHTPKNCGLRKLACYSFNYELDRCPPELWPRYWDMKKRIDGLEDDSVALRRALHDGVVALTPVWGFSPCNFHDHLDGRICHQKHLKDREVGIRRP
ncbi:uncharacterized protein EAE98_000240 [Botrytis deweyae]|uniref:BTB domain-containing protein n=1 Tax=Botrytis deweyae TaxID=2478750 RepID=A0ABQ7J325_9HELO|nr:uncharacterized protein EAE98_000240 [Botrytis deweyae]KAF7940113.1 hypothetical protein EAE98_000240 [Botrytis deweyae]